MTAKSVRKRWQISSSEAPSSCLSNSRANKTRKGNGPSATQGFFWEPCVETLLDGADQCAPGKGISPLPDGMGLRHKVGHLQGCAGTTQPILKIANKAHCGLS